MDQALTLRRLADDARQHQLQTLWPGQADRERSATQPLRTPV